MLALRRAATPFAVSVCLLAAACGARSELDDPTLGTPVTKAGGAGAAGKAGGAAGKAGTAGTAGSTAGTAGTGAGGTGQSGTAGSGASSGEAGQAGAAGTAGAGGLPTCSTMVWAGPPAIVSTGLFPNRPELVRTSLDTHALVWTTPVPDATLVQSMELSGWTTTWPPPLGAITTAGATGELTSGVGIAPGGPGRFAFATAQDPSMLRVATAQPGGMEEDAFAWSTLDAAEVSALARNNGGDYLVAHGPPDAVEVDVAPAAGSPIALGYFGCSQPMSVATVGVGSDAFLVANTNLLAFDGCANSLPLGPPLVLQVQRVSSSGQTTPGAVFDVEGQVRTLSLRGRIGGAWLTYRVEGDVVAHVVALDENGKVVSEVAYSGNALYGDEAIAYDDGFAHGLAWPGSPDNPTPPFMALDVQTSAGTTGAPNWDLSPGFPLGNPVLAASTDGQHVLVAFTYDMGADAAPVIGLLRADCVSLE